MEVENISFKRVFQLFDLVDAKMTWDDNEAFYEKK